VGLARTDEHARPFPKTWDLPLCLPIDQGPHHGVTIPEEVTRADRKARGSDLSLAVVTAPTVGRKIAEHGARLRVAGCNPWGPGALVRVFGREEPLVHERLQREHARAGRFSMNGIRIAIGRELQRSEPERPCAPSTVAREAVGRRRDVVEAA